MHAVTHFVIYFFPYMFAVIVWNFKLVFVGIIASKNNLYIYLSSQLSKASITDPASLASHTDTSKSEFWLLLSLVNEKTKTGVSRLKILRLKKEFPGFS